MSTIKGVPACSSSERATEKVGYDMGAGTAGAGNRQLRGDTEETGGGKAAAVTKRGR
jgi:hypothetical protein